MSEATYEIGEAEETPPSTRKVTLQEPRSRIGAVRILVNGRRVAGFYPGENFLTVFDPKTEITGLEADESGRLKVER